jgi:uncharacterized membrane protein YbaN (DUF454 family)
VVDWILGLTLVLVGIIGGFIPILQGWVFVLAGLAVLSSHSRWARAVLNTLKAAGSKLRRKDGESRDTR